jgi:high-affinity iron transporter
LSIAFRQSFANVTPKRMLRRLWIGFTALIACFIAATSARADDPSAPPREAEHVVHLLDYVGADYGTALGSDGTPNESELAEQLEVLAEAARHAGKLPRRGGASSRVAAEGIQAIKQLVEARRPAAEVERAVKSLRTQISALYDLIEVPAETPSKERGAELYELHCSACHGADGHADTPRAGEYQPRPANFHDPDVSRQLSPARVFATLRFGVPNTAMAPFDFFSDAEKWDVAFFVRSLDHLAKPAGARTAVHPFSLAELARASDADLTADLARAGLAGEGIELALADLRVRAPYDPESLQPKGVSRLVVRARAELQKVSALLIRDERDEAKTALLRAYLDDVEPLEAPLRASDPALAHDIEERFKQLRRDITDGVPRNEIDHGLEALGDKLVRAGRKLEDTNARPSFATTMFSSAGIALREGVEAALLIAALLAVVGRAGAPERKRWVHAGWISALVAGAATWFASRYFLEMSGLRRELIEGISALLAATVLFYVSYWLFAKREVARWVSYLRTKASSSATFSLFGVAFLAVYREAFETVLFYQALLAQPGSGSAAGVGAVLGAAALIVIVVAYGRAGKFAPPQSFFAFSSLLLYGLAVVFAGQGISALQTTGHLPFHPVKLPHLPALGLYSTVETYAVQATLVVLAIGAAIALRTQRDPPPPPGRDRGRMAGSREGAKL